MPIIIFILTVLFYLHYWGKPDQFLQSDEIINETTLTWIIECKIC
jgi:hypothetical protein